MNEFFASLRADLTDRRLLPAVALVALCVVAAVAYAVLGGSSSAEPTGSAPSAPTAASSGIAVTAATPDHTVAEMTDGAKQQSSGSARNPFTLMVAPSSAAATGAGGGSAGATTGSTGSSGSTGASSTGSSGSSESTTSTESSGSSGGGTGSKPSSTKKPKTVYDVTVQFGTLPPGVTPETATLTQFPKLKLATVLPSTKLPVIVFRGVTAKGSSATFTIVGEALPAGTGSCLPSPTQCEAVDLKPGMTEQFTLLGADGSSTVYELRVLGIKAESAKAKGASAHGWAESKAGSELLRANGLVALPYLHYSTQPGVLVFAAPKASSAKARTALVTPAG
jgi:hypothetical protein